MELPVTTGLSKENLDTLKNAGLSKTKVTLKNETSSDGLELKMSFGLNHPEFNSNKVKEQFTAAYTPSMPRKAPLAWM